MSDLDDVYSERAQLIALLAYLYPSYLAPSTDITADGWWTLFLYMGGKQLTWHIAPSDIARFQHVYRVPPTDSHAQWDGHTTDEKYQRIRDYIQAV